MANIFNKMQEHDYEQLIFMNDVQTGLRAVTCIHNTVLGPAIGGMRIWEYDSEEDAIEDAMRLARGMTYKNAACGIWAGGAKTVVMVDKEHPKSEAMLRSLGRYIDSLEGRYITAEDVGSSEEDMDYVYQETNYVLGTSMKPGTSGNPSPSTARGVYMSIKASAKEKYGDDSLKDKKILIQGFGHVGSEIANFLKEEGADVSVCDINQELIENAKKEGFTIVDPDKMWDWQGDIYCPCALGATVNDQTIDKMKFDIICGSANNQLKEERHGQMLKDAGILYAPDFIVNAGGVINCHDELYGGFNRQRANKKIDKIGEQILKVFEIAKNEDIPTNIAANRLAERRIEDIEKTKGIFEKESKSSIKR